jgi:hypothetical protein
LLCSCEPWPVFAFLWKYSSWASESVAKHEFLLEWLKKVTDERQSIKGKYFQPGN